ncbi:MAG: selenocysteine-specific elongation factor [Granulosicoccus sp.]|jgi:selenocysteine-specific elongation factor
MLIAVVGHVDHGKSTLVQALSGADTDRLPEEKRRGLTIEPGFSFLSAPSTCDSQNMAKILGFIDLPGHQKFIRNMASGVGAVDVALLVVAADDGVMPQTREHVAIVSLLGIRNFVVAITRTDKAADKTVAEIQIDVSALLQRHAIDPIAFIPVCAPLKQGTAQLTRILFDLAKRLPTPCAEGHFRLAIDRAFSIPGAGTVVTGSVASGSIAEGDTVTVLPGMSTVRVRGLRVNGGPATIAERGERAALNLSNIDAKEVGKGFWVTAPEQIVLSTCVDVKLHLLDTELRALRHWSPVHVHAGAAATTGHIALYGKRSIDPGVSTWAQLVLREPLHLLFNERFVFRDQSASRTMGGGRVIDPYASRKRSFRKNRIPVINALSSPAHDVALIDAIKCCPGGVAARTFRHGRNLTEEKFVSLLVCCEAVSCVDRLGEERIFGQKQIGTAMREILMLVEQFHSENPSVTGIESSALLQASTLSRTLYAEAINSLVRKSSLARISARIKITDHTPNLNKDDEHILSLVLKLVKPDLMQPPPLSELAIQLGIERSLLLDKLSQLAQYGYIVRVAKNRFIHPVALENMAGIARELTRQNAPEGFDVQNFRDRTNIGRNFTIDVLEYFDRVGFTRRVNNQRTSVN